MRGGSTLSETLDALTQSLVEDVLGTLRRATLGALLEARPASSSQRARAVATRAGLRERRGRKELEELIDRIAAAVGQAPAGIRADELAKALGTSVPHLALPLRMGTVLRRWRRVGARRDTRYLPLANASAENNGRQAERTLEGAPVAETESPAAGIRSAVA